MSSVRLNRIRSSIPHWILLISPTILWSCDTEQPPQSLQNTQDWYLTALWWGRGRMVLSFTSLFFFHCQYVTQWHASKTWKSFFLVAVDADINSHKKKSLESIPPKLLLTIDSVTNWEMNKECRCVLATFSFSALHLCPRGNNKSVGGWQQSRLTYLSP